jgi:hypothetical protein
MDKWRKVLSAWDEAQHDPVSIPPDVSGLALEDAVEKIQEWFFENFEDPVHHTPHDSSEGGYQFIWGGPYDTREIIETVFDGLDQDVIEAAVDSIESEGSDWVPSVSRRQPPVDEDWPEPPANADDPAALHAEMLQRIAALEESIQALPPPPAGIGHNNPPEQIEAVPYTPQDQTEIMAAVVVLKTQPVTPTDDGSTAVEAAKVLEEKGGKFRSWLTRQADNFATEFSKESGKALAKWGWPALLALIVERLFDVTAVATKWLAASGIGLPF